MSRDPDDGSAFEFEILKAAISQKTFDKQSDDALPLIERVEELRKLERKLLGGNAARQDVSAWPTWCRPAKRGT
jgi:hypothetical protein